jgi:hypothetical protein
MRLSAYRDRMTRERRRPWWLLLATFAAPVTLLAVAAASLVREGAVLVHQCVAGDGAAGWLGLRLALLRVDGDCPTGSLAVGGDGRHVMGVVAIVALPVLLTHLAGLGVGLGLVALLRRLLTVAVAVLRAVAPRLPVTRAVVVGPRRAPITVTCQAMVDRLVTSSLHRRGPPVLRLV